jgi:hypothetical protein
MKIYCEDTKETCNNYREYLSSLHWVKLKRRYKESKLYIGCCETCFDKNKILHLHHKTYKRIGKEHLTDLVYLCEDCHNELHRLYKEKKSQGINSSIWFLVKKLRKKNKKLINNKNKQKNPNSRNKCSGELRNKAKNRNKKQSRKNTTNTTNTTNKEDSRKNDKIIIRKKKT